MKRKKILSSFRADFWRDTVVPVLEENMINRLFANPYIGKLDQLRFSALVGYCLFQIGYAVVLMGYAVLVRDRFGLLMPTAIGTTVVMIIVILLARKNYKLTARYFVVISFLTQVTYLLSLEFSRTLNIITLMIFLMISILAFSVAGRIWGIVLFVMSVCVLMGNYLVNAPEIYVETGDFTLLRLHLGAYTFCLFGFIGYLVILFEKYMRLYLAESTRTMELNAQLEETIESVKDMNNRLEEHVSALSDANEKLARYAWTHAHEVKALVARMLGLLNIRKLDNDMDNEYFLSSLTNAAQELSDIVDRMNSILGDVDIDQYLRGKEPK